MNKKRFKATDYNAPFIDKRQTRLSAADRMECITLRRPSRSMTELSSGGQPP